MTDLDINKLQYAKNILEDSEIDLRYGATIILSIEAVEELANEHKLSVEDFIEAHGNLFHHEDGCFILTCPPEN